MKEETAEFVLKDIHKFTGPGTIRYTRTSKEGIPVTNCSFCNQEFQLKNARGMDAVARHMKNKHGVESFSRADIHSEAEKKAAFKMAEATEKALKNHLFGRVDDLLAVALQSGETSVLDGGKPKIKWTEGFFKRTVVKARNRQTRYLASLNELQEEEPSVPSVPRRPVWSLKPKRPPHTTHTSPATIISPACAPWRAQRSCQSWSRLRTSIRLGTSAR
jgi:hypothetical protein|mmetsp:Transcript_692/g.954  ORF Transcript_692/g.954 Transcript_692/m.954 type:complete len:218 (+) Transcript_692:406-1059(+)